MLCIITMEPLTSKTDTRAISGASWFDAEGHWPSCHTYQGSENVLNMAAIIISSRFDAGWTKHSCCFHKYSIKSAKLQWNLICAQSDCHFTHQRIGPKFVQAPEDTPILQNQPNCLVLQVHSVTMSGYTFKIKAPKLLGQV